MTTGWLAHRVSPARLDRDTWLTRGRRWERDGRLYHRAFRVRRWQRRLPEAGAMLFGGTDKRHVGGRSTEALRWYAIETRRAEHVHWLGLAVTPLFALWNPVGLTAAMVGYAVVANVPCLMSVRANRLRILAILSRRAQGARNTASR